MEQQLIILLIGQAIGLLGIMIGAYLKIMTRLKEFEIRIGHMEKQDDTILKKLDDIADKINAIKIDMNNKKNRDN